MHATATFYGFAKYVIIRLEVRTYSSVEYWIHFKARFAGVHAFGYTSSESELIWRQS